MSYHNIVARYERCLETYGDCHRGVDWPTAEGADVRYQVMLDMVKSPGTLLDFGCGCSGLLDYMTRQGIHRPYAGHDVSEKFLRVARAKYPGTTYYSGDVLAGTVLPHFDYVVMNGVLTVKEDIPFDEMWSYARDLLRVVFPICERSLAVNFMSKAVDWEKEHLFHLPVEKLAQFTTEYLSRRYVIRHDYGLYEYTIYIYQEG